MIRKLLLEVMFVLQRALAAVVAATRPSTAAATSANRRALILETTTNSIGSLGDQAMMTAAVQLLKERGVSDVGVVTFAAEYRWAEIVDVPQAFSLKGFWNNVRAIRRLAAYSEFYYLPGDMLGGSYSERLVARVVHLACCAARVGLGVTFCGFSISEHPRPDAVRLLRRLPGEVRLCCRDPLSQRRLAQLLGRNVELVADLAFLLRPDDATPTVREAKAWADAQHSQGRKIVGVNLNYRLLLEDRSLSLDGVIARFAEVFSQLAAERDAAFLFIPHDYRPEPIDDGGVLHLLGEAMRGNGGRPVHLVERQCWAGEIKALCGLADLVVSGRMHLAIASLGQDVPVLCLTYQDKFEGLMQHFQLQGSTFSTKSVLAGDEFYRALVDHFDRCGELKSHVRACLPDVLEKSRRNVSPGSVPILARQNGD